MKFIKIAAVTAGALVAFTACSGDKDSGDTSTGPTGTSCDTTLVNSFNVPSCTNRAWRYELETQCWAGEVNLSIDQTGVDPSVAWQESHPMNSEDLGDNYEVWGLDLAVVDTVGEVVSGSTSLFKCDDEEAGRSGTMTWAFEAYDLDFNLADCVAYGDDPAAFSGCADGNTW